MFGVKKLKPIPDEGRKSPLGNFFFGPENPLPLLAKNQVRLTLFLAKFSCRALRGMLLFLAGVGKGQVWVNPCFFIGLAGWATSFSATGGWTGAGCMPPTATQEVAGLSPVTLPCPLQSSPINFSAKYSFPLF
jgi:hypothetical protein